MPLPQGLFGPCLGAGGRFAPMQTHTVIPAFAGMTTLGVLGAGGCRMWCRKLLLRRNNPRPV